jgi:Flp pilus assembly protein TadG
MIRRVTDQMNHFDGLRRLARHLATLGKDEDGHILLYFTIMLPVIIGMIGLTLDGGAFLHLHTDLQELADAAALAGANELDGQSGARDRATNKAENLLSNDPHWSNVAASGIQINTPTYYSKLDPVNGDTAATGDADASYIKVTTVTRQVRPNFIPATAAMLGLARPSNNQTSASAAAQSMYIACNVQPLMVCNPWEQAADPVFAHHISAGMTLKLLQEGGNSFAPGDFGLLDPAGQTSSSATDIRNLLSQTTPNFCFVSNISPRTGQVTQKVLDGINVRFNMPPSGNTTGLDQTSAPNIIKGQINGNAPSCPQNQWSNQKCTGSGKNQTCTTLLPLPSDSSMTNVGSASIGNGTMTTSDMNNYWNQHHGANWPAGATTRYAAYQLEQGIGGAAPSWSAGTEPHAPYCTPTTTGNSDRRVMSVAVVNCLQNNVRGNSNTNLLVNTVYADFFLFKPADTGPPYSVYLEFIRIMNADSDGSKLHHIVQLNR